MDEYIVLGEREGVAERIGYFEADDASHALEQAMNADPRWAFYSCAPTAWWLCREAGEIAGVES